MILGENIGSVYSEGKEIQRVYSKGKLVWEKGEIDYSIRPFTVKAVDGKVSLWLSPKKHNSIDEKPVLDFKYSINGGKWVNTTTKTTIKLNLNDTVRIIATDIESCMIQGDKYYADTINWTEKYRVADISGNIMSLIYGDDFIGQTVWPARGEVYDTTGFFSMGNIRSASNLILPATKLSTSAYENMFRQCMELISPPKKLPATTLSLTCYSHMFYNCVSLITSPELPATTLIDNCYIGMFGYCEKLNYIKCNAVDNIKNTTVGSWTAGINTNGTLVCKQVDGGKNPLEDYIPSTWTVKYLT